MSGHHRLVLGCIAAIGLTLGALTGCATDHKPVAGQDAGDDAAFGLAFNENPDEGAKLTFGRPDSDDLKLMLECKPGSGRVEIFQFSGPERSGPMNLASGARTTRLAARAEPEDGPSDYVIRAAAQTGESALAGFRETGRLSVSGQGYRYEIVAKPGELKAVSQFFGRCGGQTH